MAFQNKYPVADPTTAPMVRDAAAPMPPPITHLIALGGVVYVATSMNVYRVAGDELVRLRWPGEQQEG